METGKTLLKKAMNLKSQERFLLIDALIRSLDEPDKEIDEIWADEASKRLSAHRKGLTKPISFDEIFGDK